MYARVVSYVVKPNQINKFCDSVGEIATEVAMTQPGFVELMVLIAEREKRLVSVVSLWRTKTDADHYHEEIFPSTLEKLIPLIDSGPTLQSFTAILPDSARPPSNGAVA